MKDLLELFFDISRARTPEELREAERKAFDALDDECVIPDDTQPRAPNPPRNTEE